MQSRRVRFHIWICKKLGLISIHDFAPIMKDLVKFDKLNSDDIEILMGYIDTFAGMQHILNKKICEELGIDHIDITKQKPKKKKNNDVGKAYG